jgi:RNase P/RNase MRP subunit p30
MENAINVSDKLLILWAGRFEQIKKDIQTAREKEPRKKIGFMGNDDDLNRKILEKLEINIFLINQENRRDFQKQRNSGFNHVIAKIAKKKNTTIGINLDEIVESKNPKEKAEILARIHQNIKLCNKNKLKMKFIAQKESNNRNLHDLKSLGLILGMPTWMTKNL